MHIYCTLYNATQHGVESQYYFKLKLRLIHTCKKTTTVL